MDASDIDDDLGMPVLFLEFGVSAKDPRYNTMFRDNLINIVYKTLLNSIRKGESEGGSLFWQLSPEGTDYMDDKYAVVLSKSPSMANVISLQSTRLKAFDTLFSWKCHWVCKKKHHLDLDLVTSLYHDEL